MTLTLEIKEKFLPEFLKIISKNQSNIKITNEDMLDYFMFEEAKKDKSNIKNIDALLK